MNEEISRYIYNYGIDKCKVKDVKMRLSKIKVCGYFKGKNNLDIYYEKYYIKEEKGAIVISHGFSECIDKFIEMIYYFIEMGYSVYAIEHRGHGRSGHLSKTDKSQVNIDKFENYVEDLKIFLDKIVTKNSSDLYLYAHSMGGAIATMFLEKYNGYFKKAILSAPMMEIETGKFSKPIVYIVSFIYIMAGKGESYLFGHGPFDGKYNLEMSGASNKHRYKNHLEELKSNEELQRSGGSFKWCFEALRATDYILKKRNIKNIDIPILLFQSGKDTFVRERGQNKFCKCANICNKIKFENAKHEIFFENDEIFIEYLKEIKKFLQ